MCFEKLIFFNTSESCFGLFYTVMTVLRGDFRFSVPHSLDKNLRTWN